MGVAPERAVCILLAAGLSARYPGDKLLADLHGRLLLDHAASMLAAIPFKAYIAVVPPDAPGRWERLTQHGFAIAVNLRPADGQGSSLRAGAEAAARHAPEAVLLALADMPFVPESHVRALLAALTPDPESLAFTRSPQGWRGPPAAFGRGLLPQLMDVEGDRGARPILAGAPEAAGIPLSASHLADFDAPEDFARQDPGPR